MLGFLREIFTDGRGDEDPGEMVDQFIVNLRRTELDRRQASGEVDDPVMEQTWVGIHNRSNFEEFYKDHIQLRKDYERLKCDIEKLEKAFASAALEFVNPFSYEEAKEEESISIEEEEEQGWEIIDDTEF